jgi:hypothetical protein
MYSLIGKKKVIAYKDIYAKIPAVILFIALEENMKFNKCILVECW